MNAKKITDVDSADLKKMHRSDPDGQSLVHLSSPAAPMP